jgi:hypothetical protein
MLCETVVHDFLELAESNPVLYAEAVHTPANSELFCREVHGLLR